MKRKTVTDFLKQVEFSEVLQLFQLLHGVEDACQSGHRQTLEQTITLFCSGIFSDRKPKCFLKTENNAECNLASENNQKIVSLTEQKAVLVLFKSLHPSEDSDVSSEMPLLSIKMCFKTIDKTAIFL